MPTKILYKIAAAQHQSCTTTGQNTCN